MRSVVLGAGMATLAVFGMLAVVFAMYDVSGSSGPLPFVVGAFSGSTETPTTTPTACDPAEDANLAFTPDTIGLTGAGPFDTTIVIDNIGVSSTALDVLLGLQADEAEAFLDRAVFANGQEWQIAGGSSSTLYLAGEIPPGGSVTIALTIYPSALWQTLPGEGAASIGVSVASARCVGGSPEPAGLTIALSRIESSTATPTASPTIDATPSIAATLSPTRTPTVLQSVTGTPTGSPVVSDDTMTPSPSETGTATGTPTPTPTETPPSTFTRVPTRTFTSTPTPTRTRTPVATASQISRTKTALPTAAVSRTAVVRTRTAAATPTVVPTRTTTATLTPTPTPWIPGYNNCGDVTGDGRVTPRDLGFEVVMIKLGSHQPRYDVNRDGSVNYWDLLLIVRQLGSRCAR